MIPNEENRAKIFNIISSPLDNVVGLDTNVLLFAHAYDLFIKEGLVANDRNNRAAYSNYLDFLERLGYEDSIGLYSIFNVMEIEHVCQKLAAQREAIRLGMNTGDWQSIYYNNSNIKQESYDLASRILNSIESTPYLNYMDIDNEKTLQPIVREILRDTQINATDARIIAVPLQYGVNSIVSDDKMFNQVKGINLYTANPTNLVNIEKGGVITTFADTQSLYESINNDYSPSD